MNVNAEELNKVLGICRMLEKLGNLKCWSCGRKLKVTHVEWYKDENSGFWMYLKCPYCGYETALWKLFMYLRIRKIDDKAMKWRYTPIMERLKENLSKIPITDREQEVILYYADKVLRETYDNPKLIGRSRKILSAGLFYALIRMLDSKFWPNCKNVAEKVGDIFGASEASIRRAYKLWVGISPTLKLSIN